jgi:hypothetical protein
LRPSNAVQHQPTIENTWSHHSLHNLNQLNQDKPWFQRSSNNINRPELKWQAPGKWTHGLCSCCKDFNMCCYASTCWCCFRHEISNMMGEHWCLWFLNCTPLMELRTKFRQQYGIKVKFLFKKKIDNLSCNISGFNC